MIVQIPPYEYLWAREEARRRLSGGTDVGHHLLTEGDSPIEHEVLTVLGEVGAALALGIDFEQVTNNKHGPDLILRNGMSCEVKSVITPRGKFEQNFPHLILSYGRELLTDVGLLVLPRRSLQTVRVIGWVDRARWAAHRQWMQWLREPNFGISYQHLEKDLTPLR